MNPQFRDIAGSVIRWALTILCTWLVQQGVVKEAQTPTIIAAGLAVLSPLAWSIWQKYGARMKLLTALTMAPGATEADVERHIEATPKADLPPVGTPKDVQPAAVVPLLLLCLLLPSLAYAQIGEEPLAWEPSHRALADGISSALVVIQAGGTVYRDVKSWRDGDRTPMYRSGCSIGIALALTETLKRAFPEVRPDGSDNKSGFSGHSAASMALSGWRYEFGVPISVMTGLFRDSANKHHLWGPGQAKDIPFGWFIGAGAQAICSAVIR